MPPTRTLNIRRSVVVGNRPGTTMMPPPLLVGRLLQRLLGSFHNLRAPGSIHLPARYLDAAEEDDLEPDWRTRTTTATTRMRRPRTPTSTRHKALPHAATRLSQAPCHHYPEDLVPLVGQTSAGRKAASPKQKNNTQGGGGPCVYGKGRSAASVLHIFCASGDRPPLNADQLTRSPS